MSEVSTGKGFPFVVNLTQTENIRLCWLLREEFGREADIGKLFVAMTKSVRKGWIDRARNPR